MAYYFSYDAVLNKTDELGLTPEEHKLLYVPEERHCTMLYSYGNYEPEYDKIVLPDLNVKVKDIVVWENEKNNYLVALLENEKLAQYHDFLKAKIKDNQIPTHFNAHLTLQKTNPDEMPLSPELFKFLKQEQVLLFGFRCIVKGRKSIKNIISKE